MLPSTLDPRRKDRLACKSGYYSHIRQQPWRGVRLLEGCLENADLEKTDPWKTQSFKEYSYQGHRFCGGYFFNVV